MQISPTWSRFSTCCPATNTRMRENIPHGPLIGMRALLVSLLFRVNWILDDATSQKPWSTKRNRITRLLGPKRSLASLKNFTFLVSNTYCALLPEGLKFKDSKRESFRYYPHFHEGLDCILSGLRLVRSSSSTHARSVVESLPYPTITDLGSNPADCPILNLITIGYGC